MKQQQQTQIAPLRVGKAAALHQKQAALQQVLFRAMKHAFW